MSSLLMQSIVKGVIYALIALCAVWVYTTTIASSHGFPAVAADKYQAVFLMNGQVYFGRLADTGNGYVTLRDVYYLKEAGDLTQSNLNLVKLGGELHGPDDTMYIRKENISYWENMKDTSRVVQTIAGSKQ